MCLAHGASMAFSFRILSSFVILHKLSPNCEKKTERKWQLAGGCRGGVNQDVLAFQSLRFTWPHNRNHNSSAHAFGTHWVHGSCKTQGKLLQYNNYYRWCRWSTKLSKTKTASQITQPSTCLAYENICVVWRDLSDSLVVLSLKINFSHNPNTYALKEPQVRMQPKQQ